MLDKKSAINALGIVASVAILIAVFYGITVFINSGSRAVNSAISTGSLEFDPGLKSDLDKYFTFVSPDEAKNLLAEARKNGEYKMLLPQFDLISNNKSITIKEVKANVDGNSVTYLAVSGLVAGVHYRSGEDGLMRGGLTGGQAPYLWTFEVDANKDQAKHPTRTTYFPAVYDPTISGGLSLLGRTIDDVYRAVKAGDQIATLLSERGSVNKDVLKGDYQMSVSVSDGERYDLAGFKNILLKNGKFVMVK